ncbi:MAG: amylo-alpha-1,6-glucosidase, partial [Candidatus Woesearchaeota archaeon]
YKEPLRILTIFPPFQASKIVESMNKISLFSEHNFIEIEISDGLLISHNLPFLEIYLDCMPRYCFEPFGKEFVFSENYFKFRFREKLIVHGEISTINPVGWEKIEWDFDKKRNSEITEYWMYKIRTTDKNFTIRVTDVFDEKNYKIHRPKIQTPYHIFSDIDYSLNKLLVKYNDYFLPFAGFWWFDQFWIRDIAYSFYAFSDEKILKILIEEILKRKKRLNRIPETETESFDGPLLLGILAFKHCYIEESKRILELFDYFVNENTLKIPKKTSWTDTIERDAIEIHCFWLELQRLIHNRFSEDEIKSIVKRKMQNFDYNIILATYFLPYLDDLFLNYIDKIIEEYSIENEKYFCIITENKKSLNYVSIHTGENSKSYHQGDGWIFLTNFFGLILHRLLKKNKIDNKYGEILKKIRNLNEDFIEDGIIGGLPELTDSTFQQKGALLQLWSLATWKLLSHKL